MLFCLLHELGHIIMAIAMKMKIEKLEIMPLGFSATFSGECINETKLILKNIAIALAGPLLTLIFIIIFLLAIQIYILISAFNWLSKGYAYIYNFQYYHYYISNLYYEQKR